MVKIIFLLNSQNTFLESLLDFKCAVGVSGGENDEHVGCSTLSGTHWDYFYGQQEQIREYCMNMNSVLFGSPIPE